MVAGGQGSLLEVEPTADDDAVGVGDPSNNRLGSSVVERFACDEVVLGSIPGLAYSFLFLQTRQEDGYCEGGR